MSLASGFGGRFPYFQATDINGNPVCIQDDSGLIMQGVSSPGLVTAILGSGVGSCTNGVHQVSIAFSIDNLNKLITYSDFANAGSSPVSVTVVDNTVNGKIHLSSFPTSVDGRVISLNVYMTKSGGTDFFLVATLNVGTSTYDINIADSSLTDPMPYNGIFNLTSGLYSPSNNTYPFTNSRVPKLVIDENGLVTPIGNWFFGNFGLITNNVVTEFTSLVTSDSANSVISFPDSSGTVATSFIGSLTGKTSAQTSIVQTTVGQTNSVFNVSAIIDVTTSTTYSFTCTCAYTDWGGTSRVLTLNFSSLAGVLSTIIVNTGGAGPREGVVQSIKAKAGTAITIASVGTFTSVTYNADGVITQVA